MRLHIFRAAVLILSCAFATAAEPEIIDLGVVTDAHYIALEACPRRRDFVKFRVEILPVGTTNRFEFETTNRYLHIREMTVAPDGPSIFGIRSVCADGAESRVILRRADIQRFPPDEPTARKVNAIEPFKPRTNYSQQLLEARRKAFSLNLAPAPPGAIPEVRTFVPPMPGSSNRIYRPEARRSE